MRQVTLVVPCLAALLLAGCASAKLDGYRCGTVVAMRHSTLTEFTAVFVRTDDVYYNFKDGEITSIYEISTGNAQNYQVGARATLLMWRRSDGSVFYNLPDSSILCGSN